MSREFTVYQATNPATPPEVLAQMAADRPDLRQFVAANPATPPPVVQWLATLGDLAVDAALARRRPAPPAPGQAPAPLPPPSGSPVGQPAPARPTPPHGPPAGHSWSPTTPVAQPPADPHPRPAPHDGGGRPVDPYAPPARPYGGGTNPYAAPGPGWSAGPYGPVGGAPVSGHPQDAYGYQLPEPRSRAGLVVAIAVGAVLVIGALVFVASTLLGSFGTSSAYGDDAQLDRLWDDCERGDGAACDRLYRESPLNSEYEEFGDTCGYRFPPQQVWCADEM